MKITPFLGNLSGKLAGNVFARGKGGAYVRQFVPPVQPKSPAQIRARTAFAAGARAFASLTSDQKASYNQFAINGFSPKSPKTGVTYSGCSAFASLKNQALACMQAAGATQTITDAPTIYNCVTVDFFTPNTAPSGIFSAQVMGTNEGEYFVPSLKALSIAAGATGASKITISMENSGYDPATFGNPVFQDPVTNERFGFALYASKRIADGSTKPAQVQKFIMAVIKPLDQSGETDVPQGPDWEFNISTSPTVAESKYTLFPGDVVDCDLYAVSETGRSLLIGSMQTSLVS